MNRKHLRVKTSRSTHTPRTPTPVLVSSLVSMRTPTPSPTLGRKSRPHGKGSARTAPRRAAPRMTPADHCPRILHCVHTSQCHFCCFAGYCIKQYKWPQDLHCHLTKHLNKSLHCTLCTYTTTEKRLLKWHNLVHDERPEVYQFHCSGCDYHSKYYLPYHKHLCSCQGR